MDWKYVGSHRLIEFAPSTLYLMPMYLRYLVRLHVDQPMGIYVFGVGIAFSIVEVQVNLSFGK